MNTDLTFITNERNKRLLDRFKVLIKDTRFFDVLVGYFFTSGFYELYKSLENTEKRSEFRRTLYPKRRIWLFILSPKLRRGLHPTRPLKQLKKIADALGVSLDDLIK